MKLIRLFLPTLFAMTLLSCATEKSATDLDKSVARREICDHLRGEFPDPPNPQRSKEIIEGVKEYCTGTDAQLAALKIRYANNSSMLKKLNLYEPVIERK